LFIISAESLGYFKFYKNTLHLYGMEKKAFRSQLFRRQIEVYEPDYWPIVHAETLYRIKDLEIKKCSCFKCMQDLDRLNDYLNKLMSHSQEPIKK